MKTTILLTIASLLIIANVFVATSCGQDSLPTETDSKITEKADQLILGDSDDIKKPFSFMSKLPSKAIHMPTSNSAQFTVTVKL